MYSQGTREFNGRPNVPSRPALEGFTPFVPFGRVDAKDEDRGQVFHSSGYGERNLFVPDGFNL